MASTLDTLAQEAYSALSQVRTTAELEEWHQRFIGRRGQVTVFMRGIGQLPAEERPSAGQAGNKLRLDLEAKHEVRAAELAISELSQALAQDSVDVTLPGRVPWTGGLHPVTQTMRRINDIFAEMGFQTYRSREVETDKNNFELLNIPRHHPARDMWDTFYVTDSIVMRTHTSPGQMRAMHEYCPEPIRVVVPGKCYRYEQVTARSEFMFHQVEGLAVGTDITMADLKGAMTIFAQRMFGPERRMRFRASYFPFTEPSVEVDMDCPLCLSEGCRVCKHTGWVEFAGAGMVHPVVLRNGGYDPNVFSGYAFGMGAERISMILNDIDDIRYFYSNDLRFLRQFTSLL